MVAKTTLILLVAGGIVGGFLDLIRRVFVSMVIRAMVVVLVTVAVAADNTGVLPVTILLAVFIDIFVPIIMGFTLHG